MWTGKVYDCLYQNHTKKNTWTFRRAQNEIRWEIQLEKFLKQLYTHTHTNSCTQWSQGHSKATTVSYEYCSAVHGISIESPIQATRTKHFESHLLNLFVGIKAHQAIFKAIRLDIYSILIASKRKKINKCSNTNVTSETAACRKSVKRWWWKKNHSAPSWFSFCKSCARFNLRPDGTVHVRTYI